MSRSEWVRTELRGGALLVEHGAAFVKESLKTNVNLQKQSIGGVWEGQIVLTKRCQNIRRVRVDLIPDTEFCFRTEAAREDLPSKLETTRATRPFACLKL